MQTAGCLNGVVTTANQTSPTTATVTVDTYYDFACTTLWQQFTWNVTTTGSTQETGPFSYAAYTANGVQEGYASGTMSVTLDSSSGAVLDFSLQTDVAKSVTAPPFGTAALACGQTPPLGPSLSCGFAEVADVSSGGEQGANMILNVTQTSALVGSFTLSANVTAQAYIAGTNGMTISSATPFTWAISGGTLESAIAGTITIAYQANGIPTSVTGNLTDSRHATTVTLAATKSGLTGSVAGGSTSYATFSVDLSGNGTITYANGAAGQIQSWLIAG
jgi:hypothetical protein